MDIKVVQADYNNSEHQAHLRRLLSAYACDPMGGGKALSPDVLEQLPQQLSQLPYAVSFLLYVDGEAAGLANCFLSFSTFAGKAILNIHDFAILPQFRGNNLSQKLLQKIEEHAKQKDCCKITLEVLSNNSAAKAAYQKFGFESYELAREAGQALFWQKNI
ncbi:MAG: GNAT family N-acetyltransferase [Gammaproteobacteria bacterium]|nr:GNAT family N-acetyltransferase [Gammaproteobacteria bacterium]